MHKQAKSIGYCKVNVSRRVRCLVHSFRLHEYADASAALQDKEEVCYVPPLDAHDAKESGEHHQTNCCLAKKCDDVLSYHHTILTNTVFKKFRTALSLVSKPITVPSNQLVEAHYCD